MLFTFSTENLCIVFRQWRITGPFSLLFSLVAVILLCAGYEGVREFTRRYEASESARQKDIIPGAVSTGMHIIFNQSPSHTPFSFIVCLDPLHKVALKEPNLTYLYLLAKKKRCRKGGR